MKTNLKLNFLSIVLLVLVACNDQSTDNPSSNTIEETSREVVTSNSVANTETQQDDSRPNIVFILVDDMGFNDVGYNDSEIATPTLDRIASAGVTLDRNYAYPICSPTRAALLTGQNPLRHGVDAPLSDTKTLPTDLKLMPEYFKELGYQTFLIGKWHLGLSNTDHWPIARGFDYHYGLLSGWIDFYTHVYADRLDWQRNGETLREEGHVTDLMTTDASRLINQQDDQTPFFLYLSYTAPHSPLQHPPVETGLVNKEGANDRSVYTEMVTHLDQGINDVIDTLEAKGVLDNTIIVFSSDNGGSTRLGASNAPFRGQKGSTLEGGVRVPGLLWAPGLITDAKVLDQPIVMTDWLPTLLEAAGADPSVVENPDGQSMWQAIANDETIDHAPFVLGVNRNRAVYDWPWKLLQINADPGSADNLQLFNIVEDPTEQNDLAGQEQEKVTELVAILQSIPVVESKRSPNRDGSVNTWYIRKDDGLYDYDLSIQEQKESWPDAAVRGTKSLP